LEQAQNTSKTKKSLPKQKLLQPKPYWHTQVQALLAKPYWHKRNPIDYQNKPYWHQID